MRCCPGWREVDHTLGTLSAESSNNSCCVKEPAADPEVRGMLCALLMPVHSGASAMYMQWLH